MYDSDLVRRAKGLHRCQRGSKEGADPHATPSLCGPPVPCNSGSENNKEMRGPPTDDLSPVLIINRTPCETCRLKIFIYEQF